MITIRRAQKTMKTMIFSTPRIVQKMKALRRADSKASNIVAAIVVNIVRSLKIVPIMLPQP
jgi:hypothetical protein